MTHRNWCYTINNPTTSDIFKYNSQIKFNSCTLERGENMGTLHYQGYLELQTSRTMNQVKKLFNDCPHLEARRGTRNQCIMYVLKSVSSVTSCSIVSVNGPHWKDYLALCSDETGIISPLAPVILTGCEGLLIDFWNGLKEKQQLKDRLQKIKGKLEEGLSDLDIAGDDFDLWVKYHRSFSHYRLLCSKPRDKKTNVIVVQGPTGVGKSYYAKQFDKEAYWKPRSLWWDGYEGQRTVVLDEYYGWLPFDTLLRICDEYPIQVEIKGGSVNFNSETIIITTNKHPNEWYPNCYMPAFIRRVEKWLVMKSIEESKEYEKYEEIEWFNIN